MNQAWIAMSFYLLCDALARSRSWRSVPSLHERWTALGYAVWLSHFGNDRTFISQDGEQWVSVRMDARVVMDDKAA